MDKTRGIFSSHFSFGRSLLTLDEPKEKFDESRPISIFSIAKKYDLKDLYLVDTSFGGFIEAWKLSKKLNINLRFGFKVVCCVNIEDKSEKSFGSEHKIIIWLKNSDAYNFAIKIATKAQTDGFYYIPRIDNKWLNKLWDDSLGISIPFYDSYLYNNTLSFSTCLPELPGNPFLFYEDNDLPLDSIIQDKVKSAAQYNNWHIENVKSIFYYENKYFKAYQTNRVIHKRSSNKNSTLNRPELSGMSSDRFSFEEYSKNPQMEQTKFSSIFESYDKMPFHGVILPSIKIDDNLKKEIQAPLKCSNYEFLRYRSLWGYQQKIKKGKIDKSKSKIYGERAKIELELFEKLGFTDYILILFDIVDWCKKNKIPVGHGRGSAGASLLLYLCDVTEVDPIIFDFMLERFLSEDRATKTIVDGITYLAGDQLPDVDVDYAKSKRHLVQEYINNKYPNKTAKILNLSTLQGKVLIKECGKSIAEKSEDEMNMVSDFIPVEYGNVRDIQITYEGEKNTDGTWKYEPVKEFVDWCNQSTENFEIYTIALLLRELNKNSSVHASGILVSHDNIENLIPLQLTSDKELVSSYSMISAQEILCKLDCLGLRNLDIIQSVCDQVGIKDYFDIDINDKSIYDYLSNPEAPFGGIFQAEDGLGEKTLKRIAPKNINQIIASVSLGRPGGMNSIDKYVNYIHNGILENIHPKVDEVLKDDANLIIYQESLMKLANRVYGLSMKDANKLRKVIGKKQREKVDEWEKILYDAGEKNNIPQNVTKIVWDTVKKSADYLFPLIHGAEYSHITALTAYLKSNYTKEFFLALLKYPPSSSNPKKKEENPIFNIKKEMDFFGIKLLPPSLISSETDFKIENNKDIRFGLGSIKGLGEEVLKKLFNFKTENCNKFEMFQASKQAGLSSGVMAALIMSGSLDEFITDSRSRLSLECLLFSRLKDKEKLYCIQQGYKFNYDLIEMIKNILNWTDSLGKKISRKTRLNTIRKDTIKYQEIYKNNSQYNDLANLIYEKSLLGFNYSTTLKSIFSKTGRDDIISLSEFKQLQGNQFGVVVCQIQEIKTSVSKKGNNMMKLIVNDETETSFFYFAGKSYQEYLLENKPLPKPEDIVALKLVKSKDGSSGFVQKLSVQGVNIYKKLADLKDQDTLNSDQPDIIPPAEVTKNSQQELNLV